MSDDKYGFGGTEPNEPIKLPPQRSARPRPNPDDVQAAVNAGVERGFVHREPHARSSTSTTGRRPGRKPPAEPQGKMMVAGPSSVLDDFRAYADEIGGVPYWEALKVLLEKAREPKT